MALETVLLALLGVVALWLVLDAGRERHRLRARVRRAELRSRSARRPAVDRTGDDAWRYWPLTLPAADDGSVGPRL